MKTLVALLLAVTAPAAAQESGPTVDLNSIECSAFFRTDRGAWYIPGKTAFVWGGHTTVLEKEHVNGRWGMPVIGVSVARALNLALDQKCKDR